VIGYTNVAFAPAVLRSAYNKMIIGITVALIATQSGVSVQVAFAEPIEAQKTLCKALLFFTTPQRF
jgi:hypothetical protein